MRFGAALVLLVLSLTWAGLIAGVSLIATPVKFQARSVTLATGAEIGRYTYRVFAAVEICFLIAVIAASALARPHTMTVSLIVVVAAQVLLQRYWLLPALDSRVSQRLRGKAVSASRHHHIYAAMEALKPALLILSAVAEYRLAVH